jgi:hypothetical protein
MLLTENNSLFRLLVIVHNRSIRNYFYFPEVILADQQRIDRSDFNYLVQEGFIEEYGHDSFGRFYKTSTKAESTIHMLAGARQVTKKKKTKPSGRQGCLSF